MSPRKCLYAICALALAFSLQAHAQAQDAPSLGDLARQAQKDKAKEPAKKVFTNDDIATSSPSPAEFGTPHPSAIAPTPVPGKPSQPPTAEQAVEHLEELMNRIDALDRATLVKDALQGVDSDFPGRDKWEQRLMTAKQVYVSQSRSLLQEAKQIEAAAEALKGTRDLNDPRIKELATHLQELVRDGVRADSSFQAVILEGRDLAAQASGR